MRSFTFQAAAVIMMTVFAFSAGRAVDKSAAGFAGKNFAGGRAGVWRGATDETAVDRYGVPMEFSKNSLYAEFFYSQRVNPYLMGDFSIGIFSRGDFKYLTREDIMLGTVNLYPFLLSAKLYPLAALKGNPFHFYLQAGGGLIYASQSAIDYYYGTAFTAESEVKLSYFLGAGIDWPVADQIGLTVNFKHLPVKFGSPMAGIKDYTGWQISFGAGYIFGK